MIGKNILKSWFEQGKKPTAAQFAEWIESYWHKGEQIPISAVANIVDALATKLNTADLPNYITQILNELENKAVTLDTEQTITAIKSFSAGVNMRNTRIRNVKAPTDASDAATKGYVEQILNERSVGEKTEQGGEIFGDYEHNLAPAVCAHSEGSCGQVETFVDNNGDVSVEGDFISVTADMFEHFVAGDLLMISDSNGFLAHAGTGSNLFEVESLESEENRFWYVWVKKEGSEEYAFENGFTGNLTIYKFPSGAFAEYSHSEGRKTLASGSSSHSEGYKTKATHVATHAEGYKSTASGYASHAEGQETSALHQACHSEGYQTRTLYKDVSGIDPAEPTAAHSEGYQTTAQGRAAHAEGYKTKAVSTYTHAEGCSTVAGHSAAHAEGSYTKTGRTSQHVEGKYNVGYNTTIHEVGVGTSTTSEGRKNAHTIDEIGKHYIKGVGGYDEGNENLNDVLDVATVLNSKIDASQIPEEIAIIKYGDTDGYAKISDAYNAGKAVFCKNSSYTFTLVYFSPSRAVFYRPGDKGNFNVNCTSASVWSTTTYRFQDELTFDEAPTTNSTNPVTSGGIKAAFDALIVRIEALESQLNINTEE